jgi:hypothetical protein
MFFLDLDLDFYIVKRAARVGILEELELSA